MVEINRVAKVVKGGRRFSFTALVVIGDEVDRVGVGYGKAREVPLAISKAVDDAKKNLFTVPEARHDDHARGARPLRRGARPAAPRLEGTGVIAGGGVRAVLELGGCARRAREEPRHHQPDQHAQGRGQRAPVPAPARGGRALAQARAMLPGRASLPARRRVAKPGVAGGGPLPKLRITQVRSQIGQSERHRGTLRALGLGKIGRSNELEEGPVLAGMLRKVRHLVKVEES